MPYIDRIMDYENAIKELKYANAYVSEDGHTKLEFFFDKHIKSAYFFGEKNTTIKEIGKYTLVNVVMQQRIPGVIIATANIDFETGCLQHFNFKITRCQRLDGNKSCDEIKDFAVNVDSDFRLIDRDVFEKDTVESKKKEILIWIDKH